MQVIIIDPLLRNQSGHQFSHTIALTAELKSRGIPFVILGNLQADNSCLEIENFYPCLTDITSEIFNLKSGIVNILRLRKLIKLLAGQLEVFLDNNSSFQSEQGNLLYLDSPYVFDLLALGAFLKKNRRLIIKNNCKVAAGFNYNYEKYPFPVASGLKFLYKRFAQLAKTFNSRVLYFSHGELLAGKYEKLLKAKVHFLPAPLNYAAFESFARGQTSSKKNKLQISYLGGARLNKGFDILIKLLSGLADNVKIKDKLTFVIQADVHRQQLKGERRIISESVEELKDLAAKSSDFRVILGSVSVDEYYKNLAETDLVLLPYREEVFRTTPSNIFREALAFGKLPIVSSGTTMSKELAANNLKSLIFDLSDRESFVCAINEALTNYTDYKNRIKTLQEQILDLHSAKGLINRLIELKCLHCEPT